MSSYYYKVIDKDEEESLEYCAVPEPHQDNEYFYFIEITETEYYNVVNKEYGWFVPINLDGDKNE